MMFLCQIIRFILNATNKEVKLIYTESFVVTFTIDFKLFTLSGAVERIMSGRFCPLSAHCSILVPTTSRSRVALRSRFAWFFEPRSPLRSVFRSAHAPLTCSGAERRHEHCLPYWWVTVRWQHRQRSTLLIYSCSPSSPSCLLLRLRLEVCCEYNFVLLCCKKSLFIY